jgi:hypothetical protein
MQGTLLLRSATHGVPVGQSWSPWGTILTARLISLRTGHRCCWAPS